MTFEPAQMTPPGRYCRDLIECCRGIGVSISRAPSDASVSILPDGGNELHAECANESACAVDEMVFRADLYVVE